MYTVVLATVLSVGGATAPAYSCFGCHGCYGSGYAFSGGGCYGCSGCYGCHGYSYGCSGCYGCYGYSYGCSGCYGCHGCYGYSSCYGCSGCYGTIVVYSAPVAVVPGHQQIIVKDTVKKKTESAGDAAKEIERLRIELERLKKELEKQKKLEENTSSPATPAKAAPATVTVRLPASAKLSIDNVVCPLTSDTRTFDTPVLQPGQKFFYQVRAEVMQNGTMMVQTQKVLVEAGQHVSVTFGDFTPAATTQR